jgi:hypothetical protein
MHASSLAEQHIGTKRARSAIESINIGNKIWKFSLKDCSVGKRQVFCWDGSQSPVQLKSSDRTVGRRELLNTRRAPSAASLSNYMEYCISDVVATSMLAGDSSSLREVADEV